MRHLRGSATGPAVPGGTLIYDAVVYDTMSRLLLGSLFRRIADDIAEDAPDNAQVLEVGCGPGPTAGLPEIGRVLRPGGRALVWDFRPGVWPFHAHLPDPVEHTHGSPLRVVSATPWRWPWRFNLIQRIELVRP